MLIKKEPLEREASKDSKDSAESPSDLGLLCETSPEDAQLLADTHEVQLEQIQMYFMKI